MKQNKMSKLDDIVKENDGVLLREEACKNGISSTSFSRYIRDNGLVKVSAGVYVSNQSVVDDFYLLQKRYPKIVFSGMSALYLHRLTDKIPEIIEFTVPKGYRIRKNTIQSPFVFHIENNLEFYEIGNVTKETMYGNKVSCFGMEKQIVEMIRKRKDYDSETFIKAIKTYLKNKNKDISFLIYYSRKRKMEYMVFELLEVLDYENQ